MEIAKLLREEWWAKYNVAHIYCLVFEEAWNDIMLEEDKKKVSKLLEAKKRREELLSNYRTKLMREEVEHVLEMAWEVHTHDYKLAEWRKDY